MANICAHEADKWSTFYRFFAESGVPLFVDWSKGNLDCPGILLGLSIFDDGYSDRHTTYREKNYFFKKIRDCKWNALDVGCGAGWTSLKLSRKGLRVVGIDIARNGLSLAKKYSHTQEKNIEYICADAHNLPFLKETFDLIVAWDTLHHIPNSLSCLQKLRDLLKTNGIFLAWEHIDCIHGRHTKMKKSLVYRVTRFLIKSINSADDLPALIVRKSPLEDVSAIYLEKALDKTFDLVEKKEWYGTVATISKIVYLLFKKNKIILRMVFPLTCIVERFIHGMHLGKFITFIGRKT